MDESTSTCTGGCRCMTMADERGAVSRRGVLAGSAAAAAVMALGACASSEETSTGSTTTSATTAESSPPTQPEESATATGDTPSGEPLAGTGDFPVGGGVVVKTASGAVVVTHPSDTEFQAFNARCPHAGCTVAEVLENTIQCKCHGSTFNGSTGERLEGPAPTGLEPVPIQVADGEIYLA